MKGHCAVSSTGNADAHIASRYAGGYLRKVLTPHACHDRCPNTLLSQKRNQALSYPRRDIGAIFRTWSTSKHSEFRCAPLCAGDQIGRFPETLQNPVAGALIQRAQGTSEHATIWDHIADIPSLDCTDSQNIRLHRCDLIS